MLNVYFISLLIIIITSTLCLVMIMNSITNSITEGRQDGEECNADLGVNLKTVKHFGILKNNISTKKTNKQKKNLHITNNALVFKAWFL